MERRSWKSESVRILAETEKKNPFLERKTTDNGFIGLETRMPAPIKSRQLKLLLFSGAQSSSCSRAEILRVRRRGFQDKEGLKWTKDNALAV